MLNNPKQRSTDKITGQFNPPLTGLVFYPQTLPGKFSRFSLGLRTITKSLSFPLLFSRFRGGLCGWPRFESSSWGMFSLSTSSFSRAETPMPESSSEVLVEFHPHVKLVMTLLLWSGTSWRCFLCMASAVSGVKDWLKCCPKAKIMLPQDFEHLA